jgi:putative transposase
MRPGSTATHKNRIYKATVTHPMLGFKSFAAAQNTLVGIELRHMIKKRQLVVEEGDEELTAAEQFYALAA